MYLRGKKREIDGKLSLFFSLSFYLVYTHTFCFSLFFFVRVSVSCCVCSCQGESISPISFSFVLHTSAASSLFARLEPLLLLPCSLFLSVYFASAIAARKSSDPLNNNNTHKQKTDPKKNKSCFGCPFSVPWAVGWCRMICASHKKRLYSSLI